MIKLIETAYEAIRAAIARVRPYDCASCGRWGDMSDCQGVGLH